MPSKVYGAIKYKANKGLNGSLVDQSSELEDNRAYLYKNLETNKNSSKNNWLEEDSEYKDSNIKAMTTNVLSNQAKKNLIQILYYG